MIKNYHTHTTRCGHATGTEREYVEEAIKQGMKVLGFSDHTPYFFDGAYYSTFRMRPEETEGYVKTVLDLKAEYKNDIEILLGFETEYYPRYFEKLQRFYEQFPIDYIIMGQHCLDHEMSGIYSSTPRTNRDVLDLYVKEVTEGLETGCFSYLAHPDVIHFTGDPQIYKEAMKKICQCAARLQIPVEINLLGIREMRYYPCELFVQAAAECGCDVILGSDAHRIIDVCDKESEKMAERWIQAYGLKKIETLTLRDVQGKKQK